MNIIVYLFGGAQCSDMMTYSLA